MYRYLEYSRFVLADVTGQNANVFYELGVRHRARESGTAIFQLSDDPIPFDVSHVRVFTYAASPGVGDVAAQKLVADVLSQSLERNRIDSPVAVALRAQRERQGPDQRLDKILLEAENAIRVCDLPTAIQAYRRAIEIDPSNFTLRLESGVLLRDVGNWVDAVETLDVAVQLEASSGAAWRELGVALNKLHVLAGEPRTGEDELRRAVALDSRDFDAWASLGGVLKRELDFDGAIHAYERSVTESNGASYPLLNVMKLRAAEAGPLLLSETDRLLLRRARQRRTLQAEQDPPYDAPWSFFDLAEIALYLGEVDNFMRHLDTGILHCTHGWQPETFAKSLQLASLDGASGQALESAIVQLSAAATALT